MKHIFLILIFKVMLILPLCSNQVVDSKRDTAFMLNHDMKGIEKPKDMLQRTCTDCHLGDMNVRMYLMAISDTIKSGDRMTHSWLTCITNDSLREIQIRAQGIHSFKDTVPLKKVMLLVLVRRYFGWMPVNKEPIFTDDFGMAGYRFPDSIKGDTKGNLKLLIRLVDVKSYPNAKIRINKKWGITDNHKVISKTRTTSLWHNPLFRWISILFVFGATIICFLLISMIHLILRIKRADHH